MRDLVEPGKLLSVGTAKAQAGSREDAHPERARKAAGQPPDSFSILPDGEGREDEAVGSADDHIQFGANGSRRVRHTEGTDREPTDRQSIMRDVRSEMDQHTPPQYHETHEGDSDEPAATSPKMAEELHGEQVDEH